MQAPAAMLRSPASARLPAATTKFTEVAATGWHVLNVEGYSQMTGLGVARRLKSCPFVVGGHTWCLAYFPDGLTADTAGWISFALRLEHHRAGGGETTLAAGRRREPVTARATFTLLDDVDGGGGGGGGGPAHTHTGVWTFSRPGQSWSHARFIKRKELESSPYMKHDSFRVRCDVTVLSPPAVPPRPPPSDDLNQHLGELLASGDGADVTLEVGGESFRAHKSLLAARSPVFKAMFFGAGPHVEKAASRVSIHGVEPSVFTAMLRFVYTDTLPEPTIDDSGEGELTTAMAQHLLVAADRYGVERLKSLCEFILRFRFDASAVVTTLVLAEQLGCHGLKEDCFRVFKPSPWSAKYKELEVGLDDFEYLATTCPSLLYQRSSCEIFDNVHHDC